MFKRRRKAASDEAIAVVDLETESTVDEYEASDDAASAATAGEAEVEVDILAAVSPERADAGPYDAGNAPDDEVNRLDLGSVRVAMSPGTNLQLESNPNSPQVMSVLLFREEGALRMQPLAAPRSGGLWAEMVEKLIAEIGRAGGQLEKIDGVFGTELFGAVPAQTPDGQPALAPIRLVAVEQNRWLLHGVFMGTAAMAGPTQEYFDDIFMQTIVHRGAQPMAPGDVLPISLPVELQQQAEAAQAKARAEAEASSYDLKIGPPEPGVHITETR